MGNQPKAFLNQVIRPLRDLGHVATLRTSGPHFIRADCSCGYRAHYARADLPDESARRRLRRRLLNHLRALLQTEAKN